MSFFGCVYHGCPKCYFDERDLPATAIKDKILTINQLYEVVQEKLQCNSKLNLNIKLIWECEFRFNVLSDNSLKCFFNEREKYYRLLSKYGGSSLRESFFGGRTNNLRFFYNVGVNESIEYRDVISEYPYVLKHGCYPLGHPIVIRNNFDYSCKFYFGFIKCRIIPPENLFYPVLPSRGDNNLIFHLCTTCARMKYQHDCTHSEKERTMVGT